MHGLSKVKKYKRGAVHDKMCRSFFIALSGRNENMLIEKSRQSENETEIIEKSPKISISQKIIKKVLDKGHFAW
jgi:hypothetical protein